MSEQQARTLAVGRIARPHGVQGELVVDVSTDSPDQRFTEGVVLGVRRRGAASGRAETESFTVTAVRPHAGRLLLRLRGVDSREAADALRGALLTVSSAELEPTDDPDEFHDHQLEGLRVVEVSGASVGVVGEVLHTPGGELLSVRSDDGREVLIPFVSDIVAEVDLGEGRVTVDAPEGLLDPE